MASSAAREEAAVAPVVTYHCSSPHASSASLPPDIASFIFPDSLILRRMDQEEYPGEQFVFVLTDEAGGRTYGYTRRFLPVGSIQRYPEAVCILSRHAWPALMGNVLERVQTRWLLQPGAAFAMVETLLQTPLPRPGSLYCLTINVPAPAAGHAPAVPAALLAHRHAEHYILPRVEDSCSSVWPLLPLSRYLSIDNLMMLLSALLCEQRIVFVSKHLSRLSECVHAAVQLLQPLEWTHMLVPLLPRHLLSYCCAPMPYLVGLNEAYLPDLLALPGLDEVLVVHLDVPHGARLSSTHAIHTQCRPVEPGEEIKEGHFSFPLPNEIAAKLKKHLLSKKYGSDELEEQDWFEAMLTFYLQLLGHIDWASLPLDAKGKVSLDGFLALTERLAPHNHEFLSVAAHSQALERFLQRGVEKYSLAVAGSSRGAQTQQGGSLSLVDRFERLRLEVLSASAASKPESPLAELFSFSFVLKRVHAHFDAMANLGQTQASNQAAAAIGTHLPRFPGAAETRKLALDLTSNSALNSSTHKGRTARELLTQLTQLTHDARAFDPIMRVVWERLQDCKKKNFAHGHKALAMLEFMLQHGDERVILQSLCSLTAQTVLQGLAYNYVHEQERTQELLRTIALRITALLGNVFLLRQTRHYARIVDLRQYRYMGSASKSLHVNVAGGGAGADSTTLVDPDYDEFRHRSLVEMLLPALPPFKQLHQRYRQEFDQLPTVDILSPVAAQQPPAFTPGPNGGVAPASFTHAEASAAPGARFDFSATAVATGSSSNAGAGPDPFDDPFARNHPSAPLAILPPAAASATTHSGNSSAATAQGLNLSAVAQHGVLAILPPAAQPAPAPRSAPNATAPQRTVGATSAIIDTSIFAAAAAVPPVAATAATPAAVSATPAVAGKSAASGAAPAPAPAASVAPSAAASPWAAFDDAFAEVSPPAPAPAAAPTVAAAAVMPTAAPVQASPPRPPAASLAARPVLNTRAPSVDCTAGLGDLFFTPAPAAAAAAPTVAAAAAPAPLVPGAISAPGPLSEAEENARRIRREKKAALKKAQQEPAA